MPRSNLSRSQPNIIGIPLFPHLVKQASSGQGKSIISGLRKGRMLLHSADKATVPFTREGSHLLCLTDLLLLYWPDQHETRDTMFFQSPRKMSENRPSLKSLTPLFMISHILLVQSATGLPSYDLRPIGILLGSPFPSALDKSIFWRISVQSVVNLFLHSSWTR